MSAKQIFQCENCKKEVRQYLSQLNGVTVHCSRACYAATLRKRSSPPNKGKGIPATKPCAECGLPITGFPSEVARRKYCSADCTATAFLGKPEKALQNYVVVGECWEWQGTRRGGYGRVKILGRLQEAHRASYEYHIGPIPAGLVIDHLCRNRACINPKHLEPVTGLENIRRGEAGSPASMRKHWETRRGAPDDSDSGNGGRPT